MLSGAASPAVSRRAGVWWGLQPYLRAISIGVHLSMSTQPQSVLRTPHSLRGIVAHLLVETQYCWGLTDKQHNETDGEKTITWRPLSSSTVSELPFVYVQWSQAVMLFPVIEACKCIALQTPCTFMQQARRGPALTRIVKDQRDAC